MSICKLKNEYIKCIVKLNKEKLLKDIDPIEAWFGSRYDDPIFSTIHDQFFDLLGTVLKAESPHYDWDGLDNYLVENNEKEVIIKWSGEMSFDGSRLKEKNYQFIRNQLNKSLY